MFELLLLSSIILPPLLVHLVSRRYCENFAELDHEAQAQRMYKMSWLTTGMIMIGNVLPLFVFGRYFDKMPVLLLLLSPVEAVLAFLDHNLATWLFTTILMVTALTLLGAYNLLTAMGWFRLDRLAKKSRDAAPAQAKLYLRQFGGAMLPMLLWSCGFMPLLTIMDNAIFTLLLLALYLLLIYSLAPLLVRIANPTKPLEDETIKQMTRELCHRAGVRFGQLRVLNYGNVRIANAMVSGILPCYRRIYLTDLLLEKFSPDEVQAIIAHEVAHLKKRHLFWLLGLGFIGAAGITPLAGYIGKLYGFADIFELLALLIYLGVLFSYCSRVFERQADICAVELTGNPEAFASALKKLAELNFMRKRWAKWDIFQSHPDIERRIQSIRQLSTPFSSPRSVPVLPMLLLLILAVPAINAMAEDKKPAPLVSAILAKESTKVATLLGSGEYIEQTNTFGITPLMAASDRNDENLLRLLLDRGASVHAKCRYGRTPLSFAAATGNSTVVRLLLESGASVDSRDSDEMTPLMYAAAKGDYESVLLLLEYGADHRERGERNLSLLMLAAIGGNQEIVGLFLDLKLSPNEQDNDGLTALTHALRHPKVARLLVSRGADLNAMVTTKKGAMDSRYRFLPWLP